MRFAAACALLLALCSPAAAAVVTKAVPYEHEGTKLEGFLAYDDALEGPRPGVVVVHEWWGLGEHPKARARRLAELGYVAFALDMYGAGVTTDDPKRAGELSGKVKQDTARYRARARAGYEVLRKDPRVDPRRIAAIGYCFGGTTALQMAYDGLDLAAVVSFHGHPVPPEPDDRPSAKVLVCHGAADAFVPQSMIDAFQQAMARLKLDWVWIAYGGAVHSFTNPQADSHGIQGVAYDAAADRRSWEHMRDFLEEAFAAR